MASKSKRGSPRRRAGQRTQSKGIWQRGKWWFLSGGILGVLALLAVLTQSLSGVETTGGEASPGSSLDSPSTSLASGAPDFPVIYYQGEDLLRSPEPRFASFLGDKPLVLNYWASNCPPCRAEMPGFEKVWREYQDQVLFVGLDVGRFVPGYGDQKQSKKELKELGITYVGASPESIQAAYTLEVRGFPSTDFFTPDGKLYKRWVGTLSEGKLTELVEELIANPEASIPQIGEAVPALPAGHGPPYSYNSRPPTSGNHGSRTAPYGVSATPLKPEEVVHNMEHGAVVVWYQPGDSALADQVRSLVSELGSQCLVAGTYTDMDHQVAVTGWGRLLGLDTFDAQSIRAFVSAYRTALGPEAGICFQEQ